jgi:hypothetical protein
MLKAENLKGTPPRQFAQGDGTFPDLHKDPIRWVSLWDGREWTLRVAPANHNFKEVAERGKIVDIPKIIHQIMPCNAEAFNLYRK